MFSYLTEAASVLLANRMRSILTIIGLVVGVAAIVAIQVAAQGMAGAVNGIFKGMNANTFYVFPKSTQGNNARAAFRSAIWRCSSKPFRESRRRFHFRAANR